MSSLAVDEDQKPLFDTVIYFRDIALAEEILVYNTTLILLLHFWKQIKGGDASIAPVLAIWKEEERPNNVNPLILPGTSERQWDGAGVGVLDVAREICWSTEYHPLGEHENEGSFFLMFPLRLWFVTPHRIFDIPKTAVCPSYMKHVYRSSHSIFSLIANQGPHNPYCDGERQLRSVVRMLKMIANSSGFAMASRVVSVVPMTPVGEGKIKGLHTDKRVEKVASEEGRVKDPADVHLKEH